MIPNAEVWHIGLYRDEKTLRPVEYYNKLPVEPRVQMCFILDPMLATGGSACAAVARLKKWGVKTIKYLGLIAAPALARWGPHSNDRWLLPVAADG